MISSGRCATTRQPLISATQRAVWIAETFGVEHPPPLTAYLWVQANCTLITQEGARAWPTTLLRVLGGEIVTAADVSDDGVNGDGRDDGH